MSRKIAKPNAFPFEPKAIFWLFLFVVIWQAVSLLTLPKKELRASDLTVENILAGINDERKLRNLAILSPDSRLHAAAQYKASDMMDRHYFSHTDPEGNFIWNKIVESGYTPYLQLGENLAIEFYNTESLVSAWMNSPTHRANILNEGFNDQGMGLDFGNPQNGEYYSAIANTFGALLIKKPDAPAPSPATPALVSPTATPPAPAPASPPSSSPSPVQDKKTGPATATPPKAKPPSEQARSEKEPGSPNLSQNFKLPPKDQPSSTQSAQPSLAVVGQKTDSKAFSAYEINRYLMLFLALVMVLIVISDLKKIFYDKLQTYDKKTNNLVLLIISIIVIAVMYWL